MALCIPNVQPCHRYFKTLLSEKYKYYEVLIPNEFTPKQPWGSFPHDKWDELSDLRPRLGQLRYPECLQKKDHLTTHIPIYRVSQITHDEPARSIDSTLPQGHYTFKPRARLGKQGNLGEQATQDEATSYGGASLGETYKQIGDERFELLQRSEASPVFPGYLSWWGIDVKPFYETQEGKELTSHINDIRRRRVYVPDYLNERASSMYGNNSYSLAFPDLLTSYQTARDDKPGGEIQLKVGGTLLYKHEICYVVMVGLKGDEELAAMPYMGNYKYCMPFQQNGLITSEGVIFDQQKVPNFRAASIISSLEDIKFNWEQLVFALYFPNPEQELTCQKELVQTSSVDHKLCISTQPPPNGGKWVCPNKLSRKK